MGYSDGCHKITMTLPSEMANSPDSARRDSDLCHIYETIRLGPLVSALIKEVTVTTDLRGLHLRGAAAARRVPLCSTHAGGQRPRRSHSSNTITLQARKNPVIRKRRRISHCPLRGSTGVPAVARQLLRPVRKTPVHEKTLCSCLVSGSRANMNSTSG
jgi:hypothetical protein